MTTVITSQRFWLSSILLIGFLTSVAFGQQRSDTDRYLPAELQAGDPDIRKLLREAISDYDSGQDEAGLPKAKAALELAEKKHFVGDKALAEEVVAVGYFRSGNLDESMRSYRASLQDAMQSSNLVLQADVLVGLSTSSQQQQNLTGEIEILERALDCANRSKNLFIKARVLGELGRVQLFSGNVVEGSNFIKEALEIDKANDYAYEPLHSVYLAYAILAATPPKAEPTAGIVKLEEARDLAVRRDSYIPLVLAENALAQILVRQGELSKGIRILELVRQGKILRGDVVAEMPSGFGRTVGQPYFKAVLLEGLAQAYDSGHEVDKALQAWIELYSLAAVSSAMTAVLGEAALRIASIYNQKGDASNALKYFACAVDASRKVQNWPRLSQSLTGEALLLIKLGRGEDAVPYEREIAEMGQKTGNRQQQFFAWGVLAEIYQPKGKFQEARDMLEKAVALIRPGPIDSEIENKYVIEDYARQAEIYEKLNEPIHEMIVLEKGFAVSSFMKDDKAARTFASTLKQIIDSNQLETRLGNLAKTEKPEDALAYAEILYIYIGHPNSSQSDEWKELLGMISSLPGQIVAKPGGAEQLARNVEEVGPMLGPGRGGLLTALSLYYLNSTPKQPELARNYALQVVAIADSYQGPGRDGARAASNCLLAITYSATRELDLARQSDHTCLELSSHIDDPNTKGYAWLADVLVHLAGGEPSEARESLEHLRDLAPDDPVKYEQLADALASSGQLNDAVVEYQSAIRIYEKKGNSAGIANAYRAAAIALGKDGSTANRERALTYLHKSLRIYEKGRDRAGQASVHLALGELYEKSDDDRKAEVHFDSALRLSQEAGKNDLAASAYVNLGNNAFSKHLFSKAAEFHRKAAEMYERVGDRDDEIWALLDLGDDLHAQFLRDEALATYLQAKSMVQDSTADVLKSDVQRRLGWFYYGLGRVEDAETALRESVRITKQTGDDWALAGAYLNLAGVLATIGEWDRAIEVIDRALALGEAHNNAAIEYRANVSLTAAYSDRSSAVRDFDKALKYYSDANRIKNTSNASLMPLWVDQTATLEMDLVEIYLQKGEYDKAASSAAQAVEQCKKAKDDFCVANGLISLAESERHRNDLHAAEWALRQAQPLVEKEEDFYLKGRLRYGYAGLDGAKGNLREAVHSYEQVITMIDMVKARTAPAAQGGIAESYDFIYDEMIETIFSLTQQTTGDEKTQYSEKALRYSESNKARQFQTQWGQVLVAKLRDTLPGSVKDEESSLLAKRDQLRAELQNSISGWKTTADRSPASVQRDLDDVEAGLQRFVASLRRSDPKYAWLAYPDPVTISLLPLQSSELVVEFRVTENATLVWMIEGVADGSPHLVSFYKVPYGHKWITQRVDGIRDAFTRANPDGYKSLYSEELFRALFPPTCADKLASHAALTIIPDDVLFLVPFEILSPDATRGDFKLMAKPIRYYPSLDALRISRQAHRSTDWQEAFLGVGDPITSPDDLRYSAAAATSSHPSTIQLGETSTERRGASFDRLPATSLEVQDLAKLFEARGERTKVLLGDTATRAQIASTDLGRFRFLHFATHGVLPPQAGIREPSLLLSFDGTTPDHMFLSASDIIKLNTHADMVVLSACNTGSGMLSRSEGVMSLGRAFMAAGAESVTVSLWQVSDNSTAILMEEYYGNILAGKSKPEALALARTSLFSKGFTNPFFWAPFIVMGE